MRKLSLPKFQGMPYVKVNREAFLVSELEKYCDNGQIMTAVAGDPVTAGVSLAALDNIAREVIVRETGKAAALCAAAEAPCGPAMLATVPLELAQYAIHMMRVEQQLAYLYGRTSVCADLGIMSKRYVKAVFGLAGVGVGAGALECAFKLLAKRRFGFKVPVVCAAVNGASAAAVFALGSRKVQKILQERDLADAEELARVACFVEK